MLFFFLIQMHSLPNNKRINSASALNSHKSTKLVEPAPYKKKEMQMNGTPSQLSKVVKPDLKSESLFTTTNYFDFKMNELSLPSISRLKALLKTPQAYQKLFLAMEEVRKADELIQAGHKATINHLKQNLQSILNNYSSSTKVHLEFKDLLYIYNNPHIYKEIYSLYLKESFKLNKLKYPSDKNMLNYQKLLNKSPNRMSQLNILTIINKQLI